MRDISAAVLHAGGVESKHYISTAQDDMLVYLCRRDLRATPHCDTFTGKTKFDHVVRGISNGDLFADNLSPAWLTRLASLVAWHLDAVRWFAFLFFDAP